jgi:Transcription factor WhiB
MPGEPVSRNTSSWPPRHSRAVAELLARILPVGRLDGAVCAGRGADWDPDPRPGEDEHAHRTRIRRAVTECRPCPAREPCADIAQQLGHRATGVWAGELLDRGRLSPRSPYDRTV